MVDKVKNYMEQYQMIKKGDGVVLGVSGGVDSIAMLLLFVKLQKSYDLKLYAVHIHHGIRKEAGEDASYVKCLCEQWGVPFYLYKADIPTMAKEQGRTEEEMGREYRYQCFDEVAEKEGANRIAVAHHKQDQAETVLFHLVRGSDLRGLTGMEPVSSRGKVSLIRPLLGCEKEELAKWLASLQVDWREDVTNGDNRYARNALRNEVFPVLTRINREAVDHIAKTAETLAAYEAFLSRLVEQYIRAKVTIDETKNQCNVERASLLELEPVLAKRVIYEMLSSVCKSRKDLTNEHVQAVYQLLDGRTGKKISLPWETEALISYEKLVIRKCLQEEPVWTWQEEIAWEENAFVKGGKIHCIKLPSGAQVCFELMDVFAMEKGERTKLLNYIVNCKNHYTKYFDCATMKGVLHLRQPRSGDYFVMHSQGQKKKISRYFIDEKIPVEKRGKIPVLACESEILWVLGKRRCESYKVTEDSRYILKVTCEGEDYEG